MKILTLVFFLLFNQVSPVLAKSPASTNNASKNVLALIDGQNSFHQVDTCYEALTCEDKIFLGELLEDIKNFKSKKVAVAYLQTKINKLPMAQRMRISMALQASFFEKSIELSKESKDELAEEIKNAQLLQAYLNNYLKSVESFYQTIEKIKANPTDSYFLYSLADKGNWQAKLLDLFVDVPSFDQTPLGVSLNWVRNSKNDLINYFESFLKTVGKTDFQISYFSGALKESLQKQWNEMENAVIAADNAILGHANTVKKSYQAALSATIILATAGSAGPLVFGLNSAGLYLAVDSSIDLAESLIDAYAEGGSKNFSCSFARNNIEHYGLENVFINGLIGGGIGLLAVGILNAMFKSSSTLVTATGTLLATAGLGYGAYSITKVPADQINEIQKVREIALENNDYELDRCLALVQKKIGSGIALNLSAVFLGLKGIGEATFTTTRSIKINVDDIAQPTPKVSKPKEPEFQIIGDKKVFSINGRPAIKAKIYRFVKSSHLDDVTYPTNMVSSPKVKLNRVSTPESEWAMVRLQAYLKDEVADITRYSKMPEFPGHEQGEILQKMHMELQDRFNDSDFFSKHLEILMEEFEFFYQQRFNGKSASDEGMSFLETWREFMEYVAKNEEMKLVVLEKKIYSPDEFRPMIGKHMIFDEFFTYFTHGLTTHGMQILFIYRHFKELGVPDQIIDEFFVTMSRSENRTWSTFFDGVELNFGSPEYINQTFKQTRFYNNFGI